MRDRGPDAEIDLSTMIAMVDVLGLFETAKKVLPKVGTVLSSLDSLLNQGPQPTKPSAEFAADSPEGVITKAREALRTLARTINNREDLIERKLKETMETVTGLRAGSFDLPKPELLDQTQAEGVMNTDLTTLKVLGETTMPQIQEQLNLAADGVNNASWCGAAWYRPASRQPRTCRSSSPPAQRRSTRCSRPSSRGSRRSSHRCSAWPGWRA